MGSGGRVVKSWVEVSWGRVGQELGGICVVGVGCGVWGGVK